LSALGVFLGVCAAISMAAPVHAQLGGLMRKAKEAAEKKTAEKDPRAPEASSTTRNPFADPAIVFITQDQLGRFQKGLQHEVTERNAFRKQLAAVQTREQYQACSQGAMTSADTMKLIQDFADSSANLPADQMMKRQQQMYAEMGAMVEKKCGVDPQKIESSKVERLRQIEAEASDFAMPPGYKAPPQEAGQETTARAFARAYGMLKERVPVFCGKLSEKAPLTPTTITVGTEKMSVVKIPGSGQDYVFRQDEATALTAGCGGVMALMNQVFDAQ
jgi:hypothetical protein